MHPPGVRRLTLIKQTKVTQITHNIPTDRENLTSELREALALLKKNTEIVIKPADKGSTVVIMDKQQYFVEAYRQLENTKHYQP